MFAGVTVIRFIHEKNFFTRGDLKRQGGCASERGWVAGTQNFDGRSWELVIHTRYMEPDADKGCRGAYM